MDKKEKEKTKKIPLGSLGEKCPFYFGLVVISEHTAFFFFVFLLCFRILKSVSAYSFL